GRGRLPVLTVVVTVGGAGQLLDLRAVLVAAVPALAGLEDQFATPTVQRHRRVVGAPALVPGAVGAVVAAAHVVGARHVAALDVAGPEAEALTDPRRLAVRRVGLA